MKNLLLIFALNIGSLVLIDIPSGYAQNAKTDSLFHVLKTAKEDSNKVKTLNKIAYEFRNSIPDTCIYFSKQAIDLGNKINFKPGIANGYSSIGIVKRNLGSYQEALDNHFVALKIFKEINNTYGSGSCYQNIANVYLAQGNFPEALKNCFSTLKAREELHDKLGMAATLNSIGHVYKNQQNYDEALKYYNSSLKISMETGDKTSKAGSLSGIGVIHLLKGNYNEALKYQYSSLKIELEMGNKKNIAGAYNNIGLTYINQGNYPEALKIYFASLKIKEEINDIGGIATTLGNIGNLYTLQKNYTDAKVYLNKALTLSKQTGRLIEIQNAYDYLHELDSSTGNFSQAFENYKLYILYRDSLFNEENTKKLVQSQMQYDFDKKVTATKAEQEKKDALAIAELGKQKVIRNAIAGGTGILLFSSLFSFMFYKRRRDAVEKQKEAEFGMQVSDVEMKALRSQMNPHFIFNSLNSIHRFIQQQNAKDASAYIIKFSRLMRLVLENSEYQQVELKKDLEALNLYMQLESLRMDKHFEFEIKVDDSIDEENTLVPPLILQPFIENSIWHGLMLKETTGKITIHISKENEMIKCIVEDNGIGREKAQALKIENKEKKSLGMKITKARIDIINKIKKSNAGIELIDLAEGMRVVVRLPLELSF